VGKDVDVPTGCGVLDAGEFSQWLVAGGCAPVFPVERKKPEVRV
jgi:hypothetical protein